MQRNRSVVSHHEEFFAFLVQPLCWSPSVKSSIGRCFKAFSRDIASTEKGLESIHQSRHGCNQAPVLHLLVEDIRRDTRPGHVGAHGIQGDLFTRQPLAIGPDEAYHAAKDSQVNSCTSSWNGHEFTYCFEAV